MAKGHIEVPEELRDFLTIESCEDFPLDRYLLTPNQKKIAEDILRVRRITDEMRKLNLDYLNATLLYGVPGTGKAQPLDSKVLTPKGYIQMRQVQPGTEIITPSGKTAKVESIHPQGKREIYEVCFDDSSKCKCSIDHLWEVQTIKDRVESDGKGRYVSRVVTLKEIIENSKKNEKYSVRCIEPYDTQGEEIPEGYAGALISKKKAPENKYLLSPAKSRRKLFKDIIRSLEKNRNVKETDRLQILRISDKKIGEFVLNLARSLGYKASYRGEIKIYRNAHRRYIEKIKRLGAHECKCIYVADPSHLYITDEYIATHNTTFGRYIACKFKMDFAFMNFANVVGGGIMGNTALNISKVFEFMKNQKCIFMLDELDCISTRRGQEGAATGGELARTTITVMQELDKYKRQKVDTIIIAATNRIEDVDLALMSRFAIKQKIIAWNNQQKETYARKFLDAINARDGTTKIEYDPDNVHDYCVRNSTLQQREIEADMIRCIANWIDSGKQNFVLEHIREKGTI